MSTNKKAFTPQLIEKITPPKQGRVEIGDKHCPGLLLRVTDKGIKSFSVIYRVPGEGGISATGRPLAGKQRRITLGRWPLVDLTKARQEARDITGAAGFFGASRARVVITSLPSFDYG